MKVWHGDLRERYDVVVVGSGGAALTAALVASDGGLTVAVLEKTATFGGTTAMSGGMLWVPLNSHMAELGIADDREAALRYLRALTVGRTPDDMLESVVDNCGDLLTFLETEGGVGFSVLERFPDYHPEWDGGTSGGRSVEPVPCDAGILGDLRGSLRPLASQRVTVRQWENWRAERTPMEEYSEEWLVRGQALIGPLLRACANRGVTLITDAQVRELQTDGARVAGVVLSDGTEIAATTGVVVACGGFEWSPELKRSFLPGPIQGSCTPPGNTGDGITMAVKVGAMIGNMQEAWWQPQISLPGDETDGVQRSRSFERTAPGTIFVNRRGRRFVNEAHNYNDMVKTFHLLDPHTYSFANMPAFVIFDHAHLEQYGFMDHCAGEPMPTWLSRGDTLDEIARMLGIDEHGLSETVERFNRHAREGIDPDFHRGESAYERYWGDWLAEHPALGPLEQGPYYGVEVISGSIGTKGGIVTNVDGQAVDSFGEPVPGLYAAGNTTAHPMGPGYPGPGGTLGPGMTMAYLAARHCVQTAAVAATG